MSEQSDKRDLGLTDDELDTPLACRKEDCDYCEPVLDEDTGKHNFGVLFNAFPHNLSPQVDTR